jgi:hypothetical protein
MPTLQPYDYVLHDAGNDGLSPYKPLFLYQPAATVSTTQTASLLVFRPFFVGEGGLAISQLTVVVTDIVGYVSGGRYRLGIYDVSPPEDNDIYPKNLLMDFGLTEAPSASGIKTTAASPLTLANGLYYVASVFEARTVTSMRVLAQGYLGRGESPSIFGGFNTTGLTYVGLYQVAAFTAATPLPASAPAGMTLAASNTSPELYSPLVGAI